MYCDNDDTVVKELYWTNFYGWKRREIEMVINLCKNKNYEYFFDIGSYSGFYSILVGTIKSDIKIYSFELIEKIFERLNKNIKLNNINNIKSFNIGVSNKNGFSGINKGSFDNGLSSISYLTNSNNNNEYINTISIDSFLENIVIYQERPEKRI